ncbi:hypothetical protein [Aliarcobacter butzleri]|uniref:hypothetical protein n=1 Tax=Aliarcobacter butzleri TaxID=28197 RepID=UPI0021B3968B|nr:hypothetical protein [Aliarcobacter butzleri]MCT7596408.1 hypothetical protein [Aliarcobacter butzleri]
MLSLHSYQNDKSKEDKSLSFYESKQKKESEKLKEDIENGKKELISSIVSIIKKDSHFKNCNFSK